MTPASATMTHRFEPAGAAAARSPAGCDACFDRLQLAGRGDVVVAVSGGGDSTALLHLFHDYVARIAPQLRVHAVTVDHALRPEAAAEASHVAAVAAGLGVPHRILRWQGDKPRTGLIEAARAARHGLLAQAAREANTDLVLVGHTLDDQAETLAMRAERGTGRGDAGIAPATLFDWDIWFARPLLTMRRAALRQWLRERNHAWIDDPTNDDRRYERARARAELAVDRRRVAALVSIASAAARDRETHGRQAAGMIERLADMPMPGLFRLAAEITSMPDQHAALYALRILLAVAGGRAHLPDTARSAHLMRRLAAGQPFRATLSGAVAERRGAALFLTREARGLPDQMSFRPGLWDNRFRLGGGTGLVVGLPDEETVADRLAKASGGLPVRLARRALSGLPALWRGDACLALAGDAGAGALRPVVAPWARWLPSFDHAPACAAARLVGEKEPPAPPLAAAKPHET